MKKKIIILVFLILLFGVSALVYFGQRKEQLKEVYYSGTIEATQADLAFQINGRVVDVFVDEGEAVKKGQDLAVLNRSELQERYEQARANLETSRKNLEQVRLTAEVQEKALPVEVKRAEAAVKALEFQLQELESGYRLQDIEKARLAMIAARYAMEISRKDKERYDRLFQENIVSEKERDSVNLRYETSLREYERARESHVQLEEGFREENIKAARAKLAEGEAVLELARSNLIKIEANRKTIEAAMSTVSYAEASLKLAGTQMEFTRLSAPFDGIVVNRSIEPGEVVSPGQECISIADLSSVELKIFINETDMGNVKLGRKVRVRIDTFPDRSYWGTVSFIAQEAEFTPKIIQTHKERVKLVYLVKVLMTNPDMELKPGMPADAWLQ
ncbi:MAG: efflux RND transporter periplasmic adaptor subunit [Deltaproteobacteria bacterium]|nr:efflux RND transporter periplasmic adaptor subunit [Deltaproteobacteria bacterium]